MYCIYLLVLVFANAVERHLHTTCVNIIKFSLSLYYIYYYYSIVKVSNLLIHSSLRRVSRIKDSPIEGASIFECRQRDDPCCPSPIGKSFLLNCSVHLSNKTKTASCAV